MKNASLVDEAVTWLSGLLSNGPVTFSEIRQQSEGVFSRRMLQRAANKMGIVSRNLPTTPRTTMWEKK